MSAFRDGTKAYEDALLAKHCRADTGDWWSFVSTGVVGRSYPRVRALGIIRMCLGLGLEPDPKVSVEMLVGLYDRVVALEHALQHSHLKG